MSKRVTPSLTVRDQTNAAATMTTARMPTGVTGSSSTESVAPGTVLSDATSLDELFTAILGGDARESDDRGPLLEAVDAQVSRLRKELGLVEPPPPKPVKAGWMIASSDSSKESPGASPSEGASARFEALSHGLPDVKSRIPRPVLIGLPVAGVVLLGVLWMASADSRPRDVSAETSGAASLSAATAPASIVPASDVSAGREATPLAESQPVASAATSSPSTVIPAPAPPPAVVPAQARNRTASSRTQSGPRASASPVGATPIAQPPASASEPLTAAAPVAATVSAPAASPVSASPAPVPAPVSIATPAAAAPPEPVVASTTAPVVSPPPVVTAPPPVAVAPAAAPVAAAPPVATPAASPAASTSRVTQSAVLISRVSPVYPEAARRNRVVGPVDLVLSIDKQGNVVKATAVEGNPLLRPAAEDAARQWRYRPELTDGSPVDTERRVRIVFQ